MPPTPRPRPAPTLGFVPEVGAVPLPGYRIARLRGRGGFATVWEAAAPGGGRVALKFMSSANVFTTAKELRSLQAVQGLDHPNLLRTRSVRSLAGQIVVEMDLADASLLDLFELYLSEFDRLIEPEKLGLYLYQAAQALDFLNARRHRIDGKLVGLQHGDVKPNNILLVGDVALLADYGLATPTSGMTAPCPRQGTVEYCPPEVFAGSLSEKSDQFSLAVTYHVLRTGLFPYPEPPRGDRLKGYVRPDPDLSALPEAERRVLAKALSVIPQDRYRSCSDLIVNLLAAQGLRVNRAEDGSVSVGPDPVLLREAPKSTLYQL